MSTSPIPDPNQQAQPQAPPLQAPQGLPNIPESTPTQPQPPAAGLQPPQGLPPISPATPSTTPTLAQQPSKFHWLARALDSTLKAATGGPVTYIDANGVQQQAPQSRATLGKTLIAATLAGLLSKNETIETPYGPRTDFGANAANAMQASQGVINAARAQPQQQSDAQVQAQTAKLMNLQRNADLIKTMSASAIQGHQALQTIVDSNKPMLDSIDAYETAKSPDMPSARIAQHLSKDDAMAKMQGNFLNWTAVADGTQTVLNPETGKDEEHPTYSIIDAHVSVPLDKAATDVLALVNPSYAGIHQTVGQDTVKVPLGIYMSTLGEVNKIHVTQSYADDLAKELGTKSVNVMSEVRGNRKLLTAVDNAQAQIASGTATWRVLDAIRAAPNGMDMLNVLGIDRKQAEDYIVREHSKEKLAEAGGLGDKALMPNAAEELRKNGQALNLAPAEIDNIVGKVPPQGMTVGEYREAANKIQSQANENTKNQTQKGNPADIDVLSDQLLDPRNLTAMRDIGGRGTQKEAILAETKRKANAQGIPFDIGVTNQRIKFIGEYENPTGRAAVNRQAINNIMLHANDLQELNKQRTSAELKVANTPLNAIKGQVGNELYTQYQTTSGVLKDELALYFAGGYAPSTAQKDTWDKIQSDSATPNQTLAFAKEIARLSLRRASTFNSQFKTNMGYDDPNMITPDAKAAALNLDSTLANEIGKFSSGGTIGEHPQPAAQPFAAVSSDGKWGYNGKTWVAIGRK